MRIQIKFVGNDIVQVHCSYNNSGVPFGSIQVLRNALGVGGCQISLKKHYKDVRFNAISVTRGWVGVKFPEKKHYVTLEWPLFVSNRRTPNMYLLVFHRFVFFKELKITLAIRGMIGREITFFLQFAR